MTRAELQRLADEDLMPLVAREDPLAFEVFYDRHAGAAYSLAYRIVGSPTAAEDVTQEALLSIWRSGARYDRARGSRRDQGPSRRSVERHPARLLRRLQSLGDRGDAE